MHRRLALTVVALGLVAVAVPAQEMPPVGPPAELGEVAFMLGTWKTDAFQFRQTPDQPWQTSTATMKVERILGGAAHRSRFSATVMGTALEGDATLTYNRESGKWQSVWVDGMSAYQVMTEGSFEGDALVLEGLDRYQGESYRLRDTTRKVSERELEWTMEMSTDGGATWFTSMQATYRKR
jgi:Protein of unknown function (DUF1579)